MLLRIVYWSISVIALASYAILLMIFAISKKDRSIKSFMLVLAFLLGWVGASLLMKLNALPGFAFWSMLLTAFMIVVPQVTLNFLTVLLDFEPGRLKRAIWFLLTAVLVGLNFTELYISHRELINLGNGLNTVAYTLNWPVVFPIAFTLVTVIGTMVLLKKAMNSGKANLKTLRPVIIGLVLMFLGYLTKLVPVLCQYPIEVVAGLINAILLIRVIYSKRLFTLKFVMTRGLLFALIAVLLTIGVTFASTYVNDVIASIIPEEGSFKMVRAVVFAFIFGVALQIVFLFSRFVVDRFFANSDFTRKQALRNFSVKIANNIDLDKILSEITCAVKEGVQATGVYVLLCDHERECYYTAHSGNALDNPDISISVNNP